MMSDGTAIMATRVTTKEKANFDGSKWEDLRNREELTALLNNPSLSLNKCKRLVLSRILTIKHTLLTECVF